MYNVKYIYLPVFILLIWSVGTCYPSEKGEGDAFECGILKIGQTVVVIAKIVRPSLTRVGHDAF